MSAPNSTVNVVADECCGLSPPSPEQPARVLCDLIENKKWDEALSRCRDHPEDAQWKDRLSCLPIHEACLRQPPLSLIKCLHEAYEDGIRKKNDFGWLPLHYACRRATSLELILYLHGLYPDGATTMDDNGWTPVAMIQKNEHFSEEDKETALEILHARERAEVEAQVAQLAEEVDIAKRAFGQADEAAQAARAAEDEALAAVKQAEAAARASREAADEAAWRHALAKEEANMAKKEADAADRLAKRTQNELELVESDTRWRMRRFQL